MGKRTLAEQIAQKERTLAKEQRQFARDPDGTLKAQADEWKRENKRLQENDPDGLGQDLSPAQYRDAKWFADMWHQFCRAGEHLRSIFYTLFSRQVKWPPGKRQRDKTGTPAFDPIKDRIAYPFTNAKWTWTQMMRASVVARYAGFIHPSNIADHRTPEPLQHFHPREVPVPSITWTMKDALPHPCVQGYDFQAAFGADQRYQVEVWVEKSSMNHILEPLHRELNFNYQPCQGFLTPTRIDQLLRRAYAGRPIRAFFIHDFDGHGRAMPPSMAKQLKKLLKRYDYPAVSSLKLVPLALTEQQVVDFELPYNVIDPTEESDDEETDADDEEEEQHGLKKKFADEFPLLGPVELDALEAYQPGEMARMVRAAASRYVDTQLEQRLAQAEKDAQAAVEQEWAEEIDEDVTALDEASDHLKDGTRALNARATRHIAPIEERVERLHVAKRTDRQLLAHQRVIREKERQYAKFIEAYERKILRLLARRERHLKEHRRVVRERQARMKHRQQFRLNQLHGIITSITDKYDRLKELLFTKGTAEHMAAYERIETKQNEFTPVLIARPEAATVDDADTPWLLDLSSDR